MNLFVLAVLVGLSGAAPELPAERLRPGPVTVCPPPEPYTCSTPVWEGLEQLSPADRANATIHLTIESDLARTAEERWNSGRYDEALELLRRLRPQDIGIAWREPVRAPATDWGPPIQVSARDSVQELELVADPTSGHLFAFLRYDGDGHTCGVTTNISTDGGANWSETYDFWANYAIPSIGAVVADTHAYCIVSRTYFAYVSFFRFRASNGQQATFPGGSASFNVAEGPANSFEECATATNVNLGLTRIYGYYNTTAGAAAVCGYATPTFEDTFPFPAPPAEVDKGLDIEWNYYPSDDPLVFSYIKSDNTIRVLGYDASLALDTLMALSIATNGSYTGLAVWQDTITLVHNHQGSAGTQARYLVRYGPGGQWYYGALGDTVAGFSQNAAAVGGHGDGVGAIFWQYPQGDAGQCYRWRRYVGAWSPITTIQPGINTLSTKVPSVERIASGTYGALFYRGVVGGMACFNRSDWTGIAEPGRQPPAPFALRAVPARGGVRLLLDNPREQTFRVRVVDRAGRVIRAAAAQLGAGRRQFELALPAAGVYFAVVEAGADRSTAKFFVAE